MLRIKIEMCPHGDEENAFEIGRMYVANTGTGTIDRGSYQVAVCRRGTTDVPAPIDPNGPKATRSGYVLEYPRRAYNVWRLVTRALLASFPEERAKRNTIGTDVNADVMRGLQMILDCSDYPDNDHPTPNAPECDAAREWLFAGNSK